MTLFWTKKIIPELFKLIYRIEFIDNNCRKFTRIQ